MPLVSAAQYKQVTGDGVTAPEDIDQIMPDVIATVEEYLHRTLAYGTYTETLYVYPNHRVYPKAIPIDTVVQAPGTFYKEGAGIWIGWWNPAPVINIGGYGSGQFPPQATITYKGGFQDVGTVGPTPTLPVGLRNLICRAAFRALHPVTLTGIPSGVKSASVGDVSLAGGPKGLTAVSDWIDDATAADLEGYVRRQVRGWHT